MLIYGITMTRCGGRSSLVVPNWYSILFDIGVTSKTLECLPIMKKIPTFLVKVIRRTSYTPFVNLTNVLPKSNKICPVTQLENMIAHCYPFVISQKSAENEIKMLSFNV